MKTNSLVAIIIIIVSIFSSNIVSAFQSKVYVCAPCTHPHTETYNKPGACEQCGMTLILKNPFDLTNEEIFEKIENNPDIIFVDVRTEMEFAGSLGHFKNAILIPIQVFETDYKKLLKYKDKELILYCSAAIRSTRAQRLLEEKGFTKAYNLIGGIGNFSGFGRKNLMKYIVK